MSSHKAAPTTAPEPSPDTPTSPAATPLPSDGWKERIIIPTLVAGVIGGGIGSISRHRKSLGTASIAGSYAVNFAVVAGCYCGARELARDARASEPGDLMNSAMGGFATGALLGRLQGGQLGAIKYSVLFAIGGTALDFATLQLRPQFENFKKTISSFSSDKENAQTG